MNTVVCAKEAGTFKCTDHGYLRINNGVFEMNLKEEALALFIHDVKETTICSGVEFQVHVWGLKKYVLWFLPRGANYCATLSETFLDMCDDYVYVVSKMPHACSKVLLTDCEKELLRFASTHKVPVFIVLDVDLSGSLPANVVAHHGPEDLCLTKLSELRNRLAVQ